MLRTVRCLSGTIDFILECEPAFDYGRLRGMWRHVGDTYGQAEAGPADQEAQIRLTTDLNLGFEGPRAMARRRLRAGEQVFCALSWGDGLRPRPSKMLTSGSPAPETSGMSGSVEANFPIIRGASTFSGPRSH